MSPPVRVSVTATSSSVVSLTSSTVGGSLTLETVMETVAGADATVPSSTVKVKLSGPV